MPDYNKQNLKAEVDQIPEAGGNPVREEKKVTWEENRNENMENKRKQL